MLSERIYRHPCKWCVLCTFLVVLVVFFGFLFRPKMSLDTCSDERAVARTRFKHNGPTPAPTPTELSESYLNGVTNPIIPRIIHVFQQPSSPRAQAIYEYAREQRIKNMIGEENTTTTEVFTWNANSFYVWVNQTYPWYSSLSPILTMEDQTQVVPFFILDYFGGLYMSPAYIAHVDLFTHLYTGKVNVLESYLPFDEPYSSALIASPPKHPLWNHLHTRLLEGTAKKIDMNLLASVVSEYPSMAYMLRCMNFNRIPERTMPFIQKHSRWVTDCGVETDKCLYGSIQPGCQYVNNECL